MEEGSMLWTYGSSLGLMLAYGFLIFGLYCGLRFYYGSRSYSAVLALLLSQCLLSFIFQVRFLSGSLIVEGILLSLAYGGAGWCIFQSQAKWKTDAFEGVCWFQSHPWIAFPGIFFSAYLLLQVWLLFPQNFDSLVYHLPRVELFLQENTFFLPSGTRYHQLVFPVGSDILYYPFLRINNPYGLGIFSLGSYLSIGFGCYALGARLTGERAVGVLCAVVILSLPLLVYQSTSTKNDILVAAVFLGIFIHIEQMARNRRPMDWAVLALLLCYGISIKPLFLGAVPGLFCFALLYLKLWRWAEWQLLFQQLWKARRVLLLCLLPCLILSQIWLFVWNSIYYQGWTGPPEFTQTLNNSGGILGMLKNAFHYLLQTFHLGRVGDLFLGSGEQSRGFSERLSLQFREIVDNLFPGVTSERQDFRLLWADHEDFSWFGPLGMLLVFVSVPYAILKGRRAVVFLIPSFIYFLVLCYEVIWMQWNGRFFTVFFVGLVPALAVLVQGWNAWFQRGLVFFSLAFWAAALALNASKPLIPLPPPATVPQLWNPSGQNIWQSSLSGNKHYLENIEDYRHFLTDLPEGATVGLFVLGHDAIYPLFYLRPDLHWVPLNIDLEGGETDLATNFRYFLYSDLQYLFLKGYSLNTGQFPQLAIQQHRGNVLVSKKREFRER